jgi:hypothetical protein
MSAGIGSIAWHLTDGALYRHGAESPGAESPGAESLPIFRPADACRRRRTGRHSKPGS